MERISDSLIFENKWWKKTDFGIEFFDFVDGPKNRDQHPKVYHFRSSSISSIADELKEHWNCIVKKQICIPCMKFCVVTKMKWYNTLQHLFLIDKIISDTSSSRIVPSIVIPVSIVADEEEEFEDISDFQLLQSETDMEIDNIEETTLETDNKVTPDHVPSLSYNKRIKIGSSPNVISNTSTMNNEIGMAGSSKDTTSSIYATEESNAIFLVLGNTPLLEKYDCEVLYKQGKCSDNFRNFLIDMQSKLQRQVLKQVSVLKQDFTEWDRSFLVNNNNCSPSPSDYQNNSYISDIIRTYYWKQIVKKMEYCILDFFSSFQYCPLENHF